jgi:hypothetical protein
VLSPRQGAPLGPPLRRHYPTHCELVRKSAAYRERERAELIDPTHVRLREGHDRVELLPTAPRDDHPLLDNMIEGERRFSVCDQGRVHTNVTNLPRQFRRFVRLGGCELVSCDVATSQPLILGLIVPGIGAAHKQEGRGGQEERTGEVGGTKPIRAHCSGLSLSEFRADCLRGVVYDRIAQATGYTRDEVKPMFLAVIYGHPDDMATKVGLAIRSLYPGVYNAAQSLTQVHGVGWLPRAMQRAESGVMIGRVAGRLIHEFPAVPLLTLHDSLLVPVAYAEPAAAVIRQESAAVFGVEPQVKLSDFTAPQEPRQSRRGRPRPQPGESAYSA